MLGPLPARKALSEEIEDATYAIVMEGMTSHGLEAAVRSALRGEHGSTFFPSPPELRVLYDKAMEHHVSMRNRIAREERIASERIPPRVEPTPEAKARVAALYADFNASYERVKHGAPEAERVEVRARYGMTPELLSQIADAPTTWRKAG